MPQDGDWVLAVLPRSLSVHRQGILREMRQERGELRLPMHQLVAGPLHDGLPVQYLS
jgi:hypothetical protein